MPDSLIFVVTIACRVLQIPRLGKCSKAAVIGLFHIIRETATGKLFAFKMILQAFAADALAAASGITAIAKIHILIFFAFHHCVLSIDLSCSKFRIECVRQVSQDRVLKTVHRFVPQRSLFITEPQ